MNNTLRQHARQLRLSGLLSSLELRLQEASANALPHAEFLELVLQDELHIRHQRQIARRNKSASFRESRTLENFEFSFNPTLNRSRIYELAAGHFIRQRRDLLLVGPPKAISPKQSVTRRSKRASWCSTAPSSTWCATRLLHLLYSDAQQ
jgi:DNA replication protein DnaC